MCMPPHEADVSRRTLLKAAGATTLTPTLAAVGSSPAAAESVAVDASTTGVVTGAKFHTFNLYVMFEKPDTVDYVVLINPNGQQRGKSTVKRGETSAAFKMFPTGGYTDDTNAYTPGTYKAYAYQSQTTGDDVEVGTADITLKQGRLDVLGFESLNGDNPKLAVKNTGTAPVLLTKLGLTAGVPEPDQQDGGGNFETVGYAHDDGYFINPGVTDVIEYYDGEYGNPMYANTESAVPCGETREVEVTLHTAHTGTFTRTVTVTYDGTLKSTGGFTESYYCTRAVGGKFP